MSQWLKQKPSVFYEKTECEMTIGSHFGLHKHSGVNYIMLI